MKIWTIQKVSEKCRLTKHTLRFWEKELKGIIVPLRTSGGQRRYTHEHVIIIEEVKRLKKDGLSLQAIKNTLHEKYNVHENDTEHSVDQLANRISDIVKSAIHHFFETEQLEK